MHIWHGASTVSCTSTSIRDNQDSLLAYVVASAEPARRTHEKRVCTRRKVLTAINLLQNNQMVLLVPRDTFDGRLVNTLALAIRLHVISVEIQRPGFGREYRRIPELFGQVTNVCADISMGTALPAPLRSRTISLRVTSKETTDLHVELGTLLSNTVYADSHHRPQTSFPRPQTSPDTVGTRNDRYIGPPVWRAQEQRYYPPPVPRGFAWSSPGWEGDTETRRRVDRAWSEWNHRRTSRNTIHQGWGRSRAVTSSAFPTG